MKTEVNEISINGTVYVPKGSSPSPTGDIVIVRAYSGVFFGRLVKKGGTSAEMAEVRQIYSWDSAGLSEPVQTCGDIALRGVGSGSKVSSPSPKAFIEQIGAIFFCTEEAVKKIETQKWGK